MLLFRNVSKSTNETFLLANVKYFSYLCKRIEILQSTITQIDKIILIKGGQQLPK